MISCSGWPGRATSLISASTMSLITIPLINLSGSTGVVRRMSVVRWLCCFQYSMNKLGHLGWGHESHWMLHWLNTCIQDNSLLNWSTLQFHWCLHCGWHLHVFHWLHQLHHQEGDCVRCGWSGGGDWGAHLERDHRQHCLDVTGSQICSGDFAVHCRNRVQWVQTGRAWTKSDRRIWCFQSTSHICY